MKIIKGLEFIAKCICAIGLNFYEKHTSKWVYYKVKFRDIYKSHYNKE